MPEAKLIYLNVVQAMKRDRMQQRAQELSLFESVEEMDNAMGNFLKERGENLSENALILLAILAQHSCVIPGVSWLSVASMAAYVGVSDRTIQTALQALEKANIIVRVPNKDRRGGQTANFVVIQQYKAAEKLVPDKKVISSSAPMREERFTGAITQSFRGSVAPKSIKSFNLLNLKKLDDDEYKEDHRIREFLEICKEWKIPHAVAEELLQAVKEQLNRCSWIAIEQSFNKLLNNTHQISKIGPWFAEVLRQQNMLVKIGATRFLKESS